jgi:predicted ferric reductase
MSKIAVGAQKNAGKTWFPELADKRKSTKVHLYYCMKNCSNSGDTLRSSIMNIVEHYKVTSINTEWNVIPFRAIMLTVILILHVDVPAIGLPKCS